MSAVAPEITVGSKNRPPSAWRLPPVSTLAPLAVASAMCSSILATALSSISGPCVDAGLDARADLQRLDLGHQLVGEGLEHALLHIDAVGADAGLAGVAVLGDHRAFDRGVEIGVVEDDERRIAAEFQRELLDRVGALAHQQAADLGRAGEGELAHQRVARHLAADLAGRAGQHRQQALGHAGALGQFGERQRRERRLRRRLDDHRATGRQRRAGLAREHRGREVPRRDRRGGADRLLDRQDAPVAQRRRNGVAIDAARFVGEPLDERCGVGDLALGFGQRLALLGGHDQRQVVGVGQHQVVELAQDGGAFLGRHVAPGLLRLVGGGDGAFGLGACRTSAPCRCVSPLAGLVTATVLPSSASIHWPAT